MIRVFNQYVSPKSVLLMLLEGGLIMLALVCGVRIRFWNSAAGFSAYIGLPEFTLQALAFVITLQLCFYYCQLYRASAIRGRNEQWIAIGQSLGAGSLLLGILYFIFPTLLLGRGIFFISLALVPAFVAVNRITLDRIWQAAAPREKVLILGTSRLAAVVAAELDSRNDLNMEFAGFVEPNGTSAGRTDLPYGPVLGRGEDLQSIAAQRGISRIIVAIEDRRNTLPIGDLLRLKIQGIRIEEAQSAIASLTGRVWLETVRPSWFVFSDGFRRSGLILIVKRALDLACAMVGLVLSLPLMLLVAIVVRLDSAGPIIYRQKRVGLRGRCFDVLKFRSMRTDAENGTGAQWAVRNDPRVTRVGRWLRQYRVDELPQFINVIRGEMSFVGPRPERPEFVEELRKQIPYYDERHSVRPGVTGWAQVQYSYGSSVEDAIRKLEYDLFYLKNMSPLFDCAIILDTIGIVLTGRGGQ
jgi:sugar transferase (PEP-CTERM system associated)